MRRNIPSKKMLYDRLSGVMRDRMELINMVRQLLVDWREGGISSRYMMDEADGLLDGHGVEYLRSENDKAEAYYVNMGDTYTPTLVLDTKRDRVLATDWGSWAEAEERRGNRMPADWFPESDR